MKNNQLFKRIAVLAAGFILSVPMLFSQARITATGTVTDSNKEPLIGVAVMQAGTTTGTSTDIDGKFTLQVPQGAMLEFSSIGFETVTLQAAATMNVVMNEDSELLDETVVVGYGTQKKESLTSSIASVRSEELTATKQSDVVASLQGKVPGLLIRQNSGSPGDFDTDLSIRGYGEPIVIIDGVRRTTQRRSGFWNAMYSESSSAILAQLNPEDIESISVLKDASASLYGIGSENGVIVVTTKKGAVAKPSVRYSVNAGFGIPTERPQEVGIVEYMHLRNEMLANSRKPEQYSADFIQKFVNGEPGYQDNSHYSALMKKNSFTQTHNLNVSGGTEAIQYYLSGSFSQDKGILKNDDLGFNRGTFQGSVTATLFPGLRVTYQSSMNMSKRIGLPANTTMNMFYYGLLSDRTIGGTVLGDPNKYTHMASAESRNVHALLAGMGGYDHTMMNSFTNSLQVRYDLPFVKGLTLDAYVSYDLSNRQTNSLTLTFPQYDYFTGEYKSSNADQNQYSESWNKTQSLYGKFQVNYNKRFGNHNLGVMAAAEAREGWNSNLDASRRYGDFYTFPTISSGQSSTASNGGSRSNSATAGYLGRVNYDYKGKYLVEVMARYDGTYVYAKGHRWGLFPSYSLGWRVSEEAFVKENLPWLNNLKIRWSDGLTGGSQGSAYGYLLGYNGSGSWIFNPGTNVSGYASTQVAQTLISWRKVNMRSLGVDWEIKQGIFGGTIDWFWRNTKGIAATSTNTVPDMYGLSLPQQNLNESQNVGIDLQLTHRKRFGDFNYRVSATMTYSRSRQTHIEAEKTAIYTSARNYYTSHTEGRWSNANPGGSYYEWINGGEQFTSWEEINSYPVNYKSNQGMSQMLPGMYKLDDRNGDGVITSADRYSVWGANGNPPMQFGLMIFLNYKGFDMSATFNGAALQRKEVSLSGGMGYGFFQTFYENYTDRYRLAEGYTDPMDPESQWIAGTFPAITVATSAYDANSNATYRYAQPYSYVNGTYLRLKSVELGYTFPAKMLSKAKIKSLRLFANGTNLLTFCNKFLKAYDPERANSQYLGVLGTPIMRNLTLGLNLTF